MTSSTQVVFRWLFVVILILLTPLVAGTYSEPMYSVAASKLSSSSTGEYWFQVGVDAPSVGPVTGASVEIQVKSPQKLVDPSAALAYWVGIDLPNDAFIQAGYIVWRSTVPSSFWDYFLPGTAKEGSGGFLGGVGDAVGPNGTWIKFSLTAQGTTWAASVDGYVLGSVNLGVSESGGNAPYAAAEVAGTTTLDNVLGPVQFRNLRYRDTSNQWHTAPSGLAYQGYGAGSSEGLPNPYSVESIHGENNTWLAGSNLYSPFQGYGSASYVWPWYQVNISSPYRSSSQWQMEGDTVNLSDAPKTLSISATSRSVLRGWYVNGQLAVYINTFPVTGDMDFKANYMNQYLVQVTSPTGTTSGSGWYDDGANTTISVTPSMIPVPGLLGTLGVKSIMSGWSGDYSGPVSNGVSVVPVHSAMKITATWRTDYSALVYFAIALIISLSVVLVLVLAIVIVRKRIVPT